MEQSNNPFSKSNNINVNTAPVVENEKPEKPIVKKRKKPNAPATADQITQIYTMYGNGVSTKEIADSLSLTPQQVNRKLSDARKACQAQLEVVTDPVQKTKIEEFLAKIAPHERQSRNGGNTRENTVNTVLTNLGIISED